MTSAPGDRSRRRHLGVVLGLGGILAVMFTLVAFSVPLYRLFCAATGYGGTTQRVLGDTAVQSERVVTVRFETAVAPGLAWRFEPLQKEVKVHLGEEKLVYFRAKNLTDGPIVGHATFNVTPDKVGLYFNKIQCFCFTEERLDGGASVDMPVDFYVDPALAKDANASDVDTITLSYTFFQSADPAGAEEMSRFDPARPADPRRGAADFAERCAGCHSLTANKVGPALGGVVGRAVGWAPGYAYSAALRQAKLDWTPEALDRWLANPPAFLPGTKMPIRVLDPNTRRDIIDYLAHESGRSDPTRAANLTR
jgi:cytochrome c oxidase assembly protein Cox11